MEFQMNFSSMKKYVQGQLGTPDPKEAAHATLRISESSYRSMATSACYAALQEYYGTMEHPGTVNPRASDIGYIFEVRAPATQQKPRAD